MFWAFFGLMPFSNFADVLALRPQSVCITEKPSRRFAIQTRFQRFEFTKAVNLFRRSFRTRQALATNEVPLYFFFWLSFHEFVAQIYLTIPQWRISMA
jgi:hypothetical protein